MRLPRQAPPTLPATDAPCRVSGPAPGKGWTVKRHKNFPTCDQPLDRVVSVAGEVRARIWDSVLARVPQLFGFAASRIVERDLFIVKYAHGGCERSVAAGPRLTTAPLPLTGTTPPPRMGSASWKSTATAPCLPSTSCSPTRGRSPAAGPCWSPSTPSSAPHRALASCTLDTGATQATPYRPAPDTSSLASLTLATPASGHFLCAAVACRAPYCTCGPA